MVYHSTCSETDGTHDDGFCECILPALKQRKGCYRPVLDLPHFLNELLLDIRAARTATATAEVFLHHHP
ncbi:hypothetical protein GUJ93_ZPchr0001g32611 [Zizania palustris]|uniref:Uncharacterized protein n=1 Tax=Zizania palustris TaxID=103762 RepID=A0A8J5S004_ZIZPA|nr:hypothetical protein GUJ93_ZPchr0001g32611 [Zizania palustris]